MPDERHLAREITSWLIGRWRALLIVVLLAPVLGPGIAVFCLAGGAHALVRPKSPEVARQIYLGEKLDALIATLLPAAVYGCTMWGLLVLIQPADWRGWVPISLVAGVVTLMVGILPAIYIVGYSWDIAQDEGQPQSIFRRPNPQLSLSEQMLRPFRQRPSSGRSKSK